MSHQALSETAAKLAAWFEDSRQTLMRAIPSLAPSAEHQQAAVASMLSRHARRLRDETLTPEQTYSSLIFYLSAACWHLKISLSTENWLAAIINVKALKEQIAENKELSTLGIELGSPAVLFKQQFDESVINAGFSSEPSTLDDENRNLALGLSVNWGIRFLLAYASEQTTLPTNGQRALPWVSSLITPLV